MLQGNSRQPGRLGKPKRLSDAWLTVPAQTVDATPSNQLIRRYFH
jgi:hypothetical protein